MGSGKMVVGQLHGAGSHAARAGELQAAMDEAISGGPFFATLGFSQGANVAAALLAKQAGGSELAVRSCELGQTRPTWQTAGHKLYYEKGSLCSNHGYHEPRLAQEGVPSQKLTSRSPPSIRPHGRLPEKPLSASCLFLRGTLSSTFHPSRRPLRARRPARRGPWGCAAR